MVDEGNNVDEVPNDVVDEVDAGSGADNDAANDDAKDAAYSLKGKHPEKYGMAG